MYGKTREFNKYWTAFDDQVLSNKLFNTHGIGIYCATHFSFISIKPIPFQAQSNKSGILWKQFTGQFPPLETTTTTTVKTYFPSFSYRLVRTVIAIRERMCQRICMYVRFFFCLVYANVLLNWKCFQFNLLLFFADTNVWSCVCALLLLLLVFTGCLCVLKQKSNEIAFNNVR